MKIMDYLPPSKDSKANKEPQRTEPFINWLEPSKPISGDEYYWRHQGQLQQSQLHFEALEHHEYISNELALPRVTKTPVTLQSPTSLQANTSSLISPRVYEAQPQITTSINTDNHMVHPQGERLNSTQTIAALHINKCIEPESTVTEELTNASLQSKQPPSYKKNHLYIQNKQVELTMNLQQVSKQEQHELIHLIKTHLKQKALTLSRLIINGVTK